MSNRSVKQLLQDSKRKKEKVKKLEAEIRAEKSLIAKIDRSIVTQRAAENKKKTSKR